jgi:hypothetical protein
MWRNRNFAVADPCDSVPLARRLLFDRPDMRIGRLLEILRTEHRSRSSLRRNAQASRRSQCPFVRQPSRLCRGLRRGLLGRVDRRPGRDRPMRPSRTRCRLVRLLQPMVRPNVQTLGHPLPSQLQRIDLLKRLQRRRLRPIDDPRPSFRSGRSSPRPPRIDRLWPCRSDPVENDPSSQESLP